MFNLWRPVYLKPLNNEGCGPLVTFDQKELNYKISKIQIESHFP